jgi:transcriptional repressor NrdR|tara:strand:- start:338 stop:838 length:501 start_codon:yes stop_codon:yes gene_type:complete
VRCPFCGEPETKVIDSRLSSETNAIKRRRECISCQKRFNTTEHSELSYPRVIKSDKSSELFSEDKIKKGVNLALEKRINPIEDIENTFENIFQKCLTFTEKEISSKHIGEIVMNELLTLDHVAYLRFASVYLNFENKDSFTKIIKNLEKDLSPEMRKRQKQLLDDD